MREVQIQIEPFAYIALQKLTISQRINQHGEAKVSMRIKDECKEAYLGTLMKPTWVRIIGKGEEGGEEEGEEGGEEETKWELTRP